nr:DUF134 domain-containing protein [Maliibacterium massiliense]
MPRISKCRQVCAEPRCSVFVPAQAHGSVTIRVEALEALRLCDLEALDQDSASARMQVSRGTFQRILYEARRSVAEALVYGKAIHIAGGNYRVKQEACACGQDCRHCPYTQQSNKEETNHV